MFTKILFITLLLSSISCTFQEEKDFTVLANSFVLDYAQLFPDETPLSIDNPRLSDLHIPTSETLDSTRVFYQKYISELNDFKTINVTANQSQNAVSNTLNDISKIQNILKNINLYIVDCHTNPSTYNVHYGFNRIINASFDTPQKRAEILYDKLEKVPAYYEAASSQLRQSSVQQADATIEKHLITYYFFNVTLPNFVQKHAILTPQYHKRLEDAKFAIKDYVAYVESLRLN